MTSQRSCSTCLWATPRVAEDDEPVLDCRRYPPQAIIEPDGDIAVFWPQVESGDWCGEYQPEGTP